LLEALIIALVAVTALLALRRAWGLWLRRRSLARLQGVPIVREAHGVTIRALLYGTPPMLGLNPKRTNHLVGDLTLTADRFVLASNRGLLADLGAGFGRRFTSVRCTGPGRLVIEGDVPYPNRERGLYRFELVVDDAAGWAEALSAFVREDASAPPFARGFPPPKG